MSAKLAPFGMVTGGAKVVAVPVLVADYLMNSMKRT